MKETFSTNICIVVHEMLSKLMKAESLLDFLKTILPVGIPKKRRDSRMKKISLIMIVFPSLAWSAESNNSIVDEIQVSITNTSLFFSEIDDNNTRKLASAGIAISTFKQLNKNKKIYIGISSSGIIGKTDDYDQHGFSIGGFTGLRHQFSKNLLNVFMDNELGFVYDEQKWEFNDGHTQHHDTKFFKYNFYLGKSLELNKNNKIEGKFGVEVNYSDTNRGWDFNIFYPKSALSWTYQF